MKKLIIIISILFSVAYGQTCDTVTTLTFSNITTSTVSISWTHAANKLNYTWALYCQTGCGGVAVQTGNLTGNTLFLSGLTSSFAYQFCITTTCVSLATSTPECKNFTTASPQIQYTPMTAAGYQYKYVKIDTGFNLPFQDTTLKRGTTRPGAVVCNTADSNVYAYNGSYWELLQGVNSSSNKVDSVIVSPDGDSLFYWINGTSYGQVFQNTSWRITGNASTTAGTNFIGTTDSVRLDLRTNNTIRQSITGSGNVGIGTVTPQRKFEVNGTMYLVDEFTHYNQFINGGNSSAYGYYNVVNGFEGLKAVTSGSHNMAMGANSLILNTTGSNNIAIGYLSLGTNVSGSQNIAIGSGAGRYNTLSNRLYINSLVHTNILDDTTKSIIYGYQDATASNQRLYLNSQLYLPYAASGVGTKALRINPSTGIVTYADTTAGGGISSDSLLWSQNGTNIFNKSNRSVGVGTSTPVSKLQVNGGVRSDSVITPYITSASGDLSVNGASNLILTGLAGAVELYSNSGGDINLSSDKNVQIVGDSVSIEPNNKVNIGIPSVYTQSALLDITSTTKGLLIPRMTTTQRNAISSPATGLLIWNTTDSTLNQYRGLSGWSAIGSTYSAGYGLSLASTTFSADSSVLMNKAGNTFSTTTGTGVSLISSTVTSGSLMKLTNTGTAAASNTKNVLSIVSSGANGTASQTVTGQTISVTNTGTTNTNVGLNVTASGATNNYAALFTGMVGIGTGSPSAALHIVPASASIAPLLLNAVSGFTGNLIDAKVNGVSKFIVDKDGSLTANSINSTKINYNNIIGGISGTASTFAIYNNATSYSTEFQIHGSAEASGAGISLPSGYLLINGATVAPSAIADLQSTTKGFLPPRMTATQGSAISSPAEGLLIYVTNTNGTFTAKGWWGYDGAAWQKLNN